MIAPLEQERTPFNMAEDKNDDDCGQLAEAEFLNKRQRKEKERKRGKKDSAAAA